MISSLLQALGANDAQAQQQGDGNSTNTQANDGSSQSDQGTCTSSSHFLKCGHRAFTGDQPHSQICSMNCRHPQGLDRVEPAHECPQCSHRTCTKSGHLLSCGHFVHGNFGRQKTKRSRENEPSNENDGYWCSRLCQIPLWPVKESVVKCPTCDRWERETALAHYAERLKDKYAELGAHQYGCYRKDFDPEKARDEIGRINSEARKVCGIDVWNTLQLQGPVNFLNHTQRRKDIVASRLKTHLAAVQNTIDPNNPNADNQDGSLDDKNLKRLARMVADELRTDAVSDAINLRGLHKSPQMKEPDPSPTESSSHSSSQSEETEDDIEEKASIVQNIIVDLNARCNPDRNVIPVSLRGKESLLVNTARIKTYGDFIKSINFLIHTSSHFLRFYRWVSFSVFSDEALAKNCLSNGMAYGEMRDSQMNSCLEQLPQDYKCVVERIFILFFSEPARYRNLIWQDKKRYRRLVAGRASLEELQELEEEIRLIDIQHPPGQAFPGEEYSDSDEEELISQIPAEAFNVPKDENPDIFDRPGPWIEGRPVLSEAELRRRFANATPLMESVHPINIKEPEQPPLRTFKQVPPTHLAKKSITDGLPGIAWDNGDRYMGRLGQAFPRLDASQRERGIVLHQHLPGDESSIQQTGQAYYRREEREIYQPGLRRQHNERFGLTHQQEVYLNPYAGAKPQGATSLRSGSYVRRDPNGHGPTEPPEDTSAKRSPNPAGSLPGILKIGFPLVPVQSSTSSEVDLYGSSVGPQPQQHVPRMPTIPEGGSHAQPGLDPTAQSKGENAPAEGKGSLEKKGSQEEKVSSAEKFTTPPEEKGPEHDAEPPKRVSFSVLPSRESSL